MKCYYFLILVTKLEKVYRYLKSTSESTFLKYETAVYKKFSKKKIKKNPPTNIMIEI